MQSGWNICQPVAPPPESALRLSVPVVLVLWGPVCVYLYVRVVSLYLGSSPGPKVLGYLLFG